MSATNRGTPRASADFYVTPSFCVYRLLERLDLPGGKWLEPCAGDGAIIRAVNRVRSDVQWYAGEIRAECEEELLPLVHRPRRLWLGRFSLSFNPLRQRHYSVIFTNPPYNQAEQFIHDCLPLADYTVMLLRLNFWGSDRRQRFLQRHAPDTYVLPNRPAFVGGKTDATEYAWLVWHGARVRHHGRILVLDSTTVADRAA